MLHPLGYHRKGEQGLVDTEEWEEIRVGKSFPDHCLMAEFLSSVRPPLALRRQGCKQPHLL